MSVKARLILMAVAAFLGLILTGVMGVSGLSDVQENSENMYNNSVLPATELGYINGVVGKIVADMLLALQHNPESPLHKLHDHPVSVHIDSADNWKKTFDKHWELAKKGFNEEAEKALEKTISDNYTKFITEIYEPVKNNLNTGVSALDTTIILTEGFKKYAEPLEHAIGDLIGIQEDLAEVGYKTSFEIFSKIRVTVIVTVVICSVLMAVLAFSIVYSIAEPLSRISAMMRDIVKTGNFTERLKIKAMDEVGQTASTFNELLESLQSTFKMMLDYTSQFDQASEELARLSDKVAKASVKTSDSSSDMAASVEEMTASIVQVGENAKETNVNAEDVMALSEEGDKIVNRTISEMKKMSQAVENSSETIGELGRQSEQISGIVQTIKDVADQTNLLALNAAIEAARAGEQGRGFAVVADEIRKLAERTTRATTEIAAMISAIQESSHTAVTSMTHAASMVSEGVSLAEQAGESINKIQQGAQQAKSRVSGITAALNEQSSASHQIASQVERVAQATDENSEAATSSSKAAEHIAKLARLMREAMAKFRV